MAGKLGNPISNPVKGEITFDANTITEQFAIYANEAVAKNVPENIGVLIHFKSGRLSTEYVQFYISSTSKFYVRIKSYGYGWHPWVEK